MIRMRAICRVLCLAILWPAAGAAADMPRLVHRHGQFMLMVDGAPFTVLAVQMHNSSAWPTRMPAVWKAVDSLHANTVEAPVYWEQLEPRSDVYNYSAVDMLIDQSRQHGVRLIILWFGTWKNGEMHYVPEWIKRDRVRYLRVINTRRSAVDDLSPMAQSNLDADRAAFVALMRHIKRRDSHIHTVIMVQVENEPGLIGTVRDHSIEAQKRFEESVPAGAIPAGQAGTGNWPRIFGIEADELFSAYQVSRYIDAVAAAGKSVYPLPLYVNVWMRYKGFVSPGVDYPSGGATWNVLDLWKRMTPHIDLIGTDVYTTDFAEYRRAVSPYQRADNPPWISESEFAPLTARYLFDILAHGGIGGSVFGVDEPDKDEEAAKSVSAAIQAHSRNFSLLAPIESYLARVAAAHQIYSAVEQPGQQTTTLSLPGGWRAAVSFGTFRPQGGLTLQDASPNSDGRVMIVVEDQTHFLIVGMGARVRLIPDDKPPLREILRVEQGRLKKRWVADRILNGDETDFGYDLDDSGTILRVTTD